MMIAKQNRLLKLGIVLFITASIPSLLHLRYTNEFITADRYGYFPMIGIVLAIFAIFDTQSKIRKRVLLIFMTLWFLFMFINNRKTLNTWSNDIAFWKHETATKPKSAVDYYFLGLSYQQKGDYTNALQAYSNCLKNDPNYQKAYITCGSIFFEIKQYKQSENFYKKALESDNNNRALILNNMAELKLKQKKVDEALDYSMKSIKEDNSNGEAYLRISQIYLYKNNKTKAVYYALKASKLGIQLSPELKQIVQENR